MAAEQELLAFAQLAGQTVVAAAATDLWGKTKSGIAALLGRKDPEQAQVTARRLAETRADLIAAPEADLEKVRGELEAKWTIRLADLLEENPGVAGELRALVNEIRTELPGAAAAVSGHGVVAGRDIRITASTGGVAAAVIRGDVSAGNPTRPGSAAT